MAITYGWLLVGLISTIIALAMAEIASAYPTAGGLYYWASKLGGPGWGWTTGWFNLIGQIAVTASIGYGLATFAQVLFDLLVRVRRAHERLVRDLVQRVGLRPLRDLPGSRRPSINMFKVTITAMLNTVSAYWHMVGVAFIVLVLIIVPNQHQSFGVRVHATPSTRRATAARRTTSRNPAFWFVFGLGLLLSQYTITGFDASAHIAEETHPHRGWRRSGMYMSVVVSVVFGWILLLAVTFAIPSTQGALENVGDDRAVDLGGSR